MHSEDERSQHLRARGTSPAPTVASTAPSVNSYGTSGWRSSARTSATEFEELYAEPSETSDDDSEIVPLMCSNSIKKAMSRTQLNRDSLPSLVIPSPTAWPTIQKLKESEATKQDSIPPVPPKVLLSPAALASLGSITLPIPGKNSTPSLDGSAPSDETASISPATPDLRSKADSDEAWDMPVQLDPQALDTLQQLSCQFSSQELGPIIEASEGQLGEMQERGLNIDTVVAPERIDSRRRSNTGLGQEPISAISVPSPGGFLASLDTTSQYTWSISRADDAPSTTTAEHFYEVPWNVAAPGPVVQRVLELDGAKDDGDDDSEGPPTARQNKFLVNASPSPQSGDDAVQEMLVIKGDREYEYDENYVKKLHDTAASNMSRTSQWLSAQDNYLSALKESNPVNNEPQAEMPQTSFGSSRDSPITGSPTTTSKDSSEVSRFTSPKKAVRFAGASEPKSAAKTPVTAIRYVSSSEHNDPLIYHAFQHIKSLCGANGSAAYQMRQFRADAVHTQRLYSPRKHHQRLSGRFDPVTVPRRVATDFASTLPSAPDEPTTRERRAHIKQTERERDALSLIETGYWNLEANRYLFSGQAGDLLPTAAREVLEIAEYSSHTARVLDLGGLPTADWGWAVAMEHKRAKIYTAVITPRSSHISNAEKNEEIDQSEGLSSSTWLHHRGPSNHRTLSIDHPWILPFASDTFDVVSARTLHMYLKNRKPYPSPTPRSRSPLNTSDQAPFSSDLGLQDSAPKQPAYSDEFTATLAEIRRILKPGGFLHYNLFDAEVASAPIDSTTPPLRHSPASSQDSKEAPDGLSQQLERHRRAVADASAAEISMEQLQALISPTSANAGGPSALHGRSVEFSFSLRSLGYDPRAGHRINERLANAGFDNSPETHQSQWTLLPVSCGQQVHDKDGRVREPSGIGAITEVVGAMAWERWMLKVQREDLGREEGKWLEGVAAGIDAARKAAEGTRGCWRMRVGVVRK